MSVHRGGLLELVSRGKKDAFFTANPKISFFHSVYVRAAPFTEELYVMKPRNVAEWGRWCEFDFEHRGDLVRKFYLRIQLPTWLPESLVAVNRRAVITDNTGVAFGYCNNVGFQVIDKIQLLQDQIIVQELYGEALDWRLRQTNSLATTLVIAGSVGTRGESSIDVGKSATPGMLRVPIPFLGWGSVGDPGFPMVALTKQRFRIRILMRKWEDVIVASDGRLKPQPWGVGLRIQETRGGPVDTSQRTLTYEQFIRQGIDVSLETTQVYVPPDVQEWLKIQRWVLPYRNTQHLAFQIQDNQMNAASTAAVGSFTLSFPLDFTGPAARLMMGFQRVGARLAGQRTFLLSDVAASLRINVANLDRMRPFSPRVYQDLTAYWKQVRAAQDLSDLDLPHPVYTFVFGGFDSDQPYGTLNFTRATQPILVILFNPTDIDPRTRSRELFLTTYLETFDLWEIQGGKGRVLIDE